MQLLRELWNYREMTMSLVKRDLKSRYKGSVLGFFWMFLNPLLQLAVYTVVFGYLMKSNIERFYLFLFVALVPWFFFSTCLSAGTSVVISQQDLVKKIYFPRQILPISFTISQFINMVLSFIVVFVIVVFSGVGISFKALLFLPVVMLIEFILALGVAFLVSAITVYLRDLEHILSIVSMAWMYMTPIVYPIDIVPEAIMPIYYFNPMTEIVTAYRDILYYKQIPETGSLLYSLAVSIVFLLAGSFVFGRLQRKFAEEL